MSAHMSCCSVSAVSCVATSSWSMYCLMQDPRDVELIWDQMFRGTLNYGRKGLPLYVLSVTLGCSYTCTCPSFVCLSWPCTASAGRPSVPWTWHSGTCWESCAMNLSMHSSVGKPKYMSSGPAQVHTCCGAGEGMVCLSGACVCVLAVSVTSDPVPLPASLSCLSTAPQPGQTLPRCQWHMHISDCLLMSL